MPRLFWSLVAAVAFVLESTQAQLILYNSAAAINTAVTLSTACENAMMANISCPSNLFNFAGVGDLVATDNTTVPQICATSCTGSLTSYHNSIVTACANDPYPWTGIPATWPGDVLWAFANSTCLMNSTTGEYCVDEVLSWWTTLDTNDVLLSDYPAQYLCTPCMIKLLAQSQSTSFSNYNTDFIDDWKGVQAVCNVTYSTDVQPPATNLTLADLPNYVNTSALAEVPCVSGNTYTVQSGDTCNSIATSKSVASGTLLIINNLYADCSGLIEGQSICLPPTCSTYQIHVNDTCWSVSAAQSVGVYQLQGWNPAINSGCTNMKVGSTICISPPGGTWNGTTIAGATPTQVNPYASTTVAPPGPTPFGTTSHCGAYYKAQSGDYCQQISLNRTITVDLFEEINPSINKNCTNLTPGFYYCVYPTADWNVTILNCTTLTAVTGPASATTGAISPCYEWYTIQSGDSCSSIEIEYSITFAQLQAWNSNLNSTCGNLILGDAYCVNGLNSSCPASSSPSTNITAMSRVSSTTTTSATHITSSAVVTPTPHQLKMVSGCKSFHEAVSADTCSGIATKYYITLDQFYAWNPDVGNTCSALWVDEWYCVET